jgi:hypothetical protein
MSHIDTLLSYADPALTDSVPALPTGFWEGSASLLAELLALLENRNGCFVFARALHLFPTHSFSKPLSGYDIVAWNSRELWKEMFPEEVQSLLFFAEDIFGCQWALRADHVCKFDPETGNVTRFADNLEDWAKQILKNARIETGWPLSQQWIQAHGNLPAHCRLSPKRLFVMGGSFTLDNLFAIDAVEGMRFRGDIARQIRKLPDGTKIKIVRADEPL